MNDDVRTIRRIMQFFGVIVGLLLAYGAIIFIMGVIDEYQRLG